MQKTYHYLRHIQKVRAFMSKKCYTSLTLQWLFSIQQLLLDLDFAMKVVGLCL